MTLEHLLLYEASSIGIRRASYKTGVHDNVHVLTSTAYVTINQGRYSTTVSSIRHELLWHDYRHQGNRKTWVNYRDASVSTFILNYGRQVQRVDNLRCSARCNHWSVRSPSSRAPNIAQTFSHAGGNALPILLELFGTLSEYPNPSHK